MIERFPLRQRRLLAAAILAGLLLLLWAALVQPVARALHHALSDKVRVQRLLQAYEQDIGSEAGWKEAYQKLMAANAGTMFVRDKNASLATARFQSDIKQSLEQHKATIGSVQALSPVKDGELQRVTVRTAFTIPLRNLEALLTALEHQEPSIFLDNLVIAAPPDGTADTDQAPLSVQCDFVAYLLSGTA